MIATKDGSFYAAYYGQSMNPTLKEPMVIKVVPYKENSIKSGDVIFYSSKGAERNIVHRVARVENGRVFTRGDNNLASDTFPLYPQEIQGKVVAAYRGKREWKIAGGFFGRIWGISLYVRNRIARTRFTRPRALVRAVIQYGTH